MRLAICDDDSEILSSITVFLNRTYQDLSLLIDSYSSAEKLIHVIKNQNKHYDLLLLDIEMSGIDGIQAAKESHLLLPDLYIAFITSHEEYSLIGYEVSAFRYLVKPLQPDKILEVIETVRQEISNQKKILIQQDGVERTVRVKDIVYLEAQNQYVKIVTTKETYLNRGTLDSYEKNLIMEDFYRCHRSYLVNLRYITFIDKRDIQVVTGDSVILSRLKSKDFVEVFQNYIKRNAR